MSAIEKGTAAHKALSENADVLIVGENMYDALRESAMKGLAESGQVILDPVFVKPVDIIMSEAMYDALTDY